MFTMQTNAPSGKVFTKNFVVPVYLCNDYKGFLSSISITIL